MKRISLLFILFLYASLTAGVVACGKHNEQQTIQGGQDSGGGNTTQSTIEDVEFYYKRVTPLLPSILSHFFFEGTISNFRATIKALISDLKKFYATIEETTNHVSQYN